MTVTDALATLRAAGCRLWIDGGGVAVDRPAPPPPEVTAAMEALRPHREEVRAALADVSAFVSARCCRSLRVWCEADRLHERYRAHGGRQDRGAFLAAMLADGTLRMEAAGLVAGVGLREDSGPEDGGTRSKRERGRRV